jgi:hypothetical protein
MSIQVSADQWAQRHKPAAAEPPAVLTIPPRLRFASTILRTIFIVALVVTIVHVSMPQSETLWTIYDTPRDLLRLLLGLAAAAWIAAQLLAMPKDLHAHRTWLHVGLVAVPFVLICIVAIW